jgi:galactokinase
LNFNLNTKTVKSRCPGRISLSKHADYINSHLLYVLDDRETVIESELSQGDSVIKLSNKDFGDREIKLENLEKSLENKLDWSFYVLKIIQELELENQLKDKELRIKVTSSIPAAGGLSSSHALLLSCLRNLSELFDLRQFSEVFKDPGNNKSKTFELIKLCQKIEQERGFKSGLGDQCAQLFSKKGYLTGIKIFPNLEISYIPIPEDLSFITVPSFISADKSTPEFVQKNINIEKYKTLNNLSKKFSCDYLADLHNKLSEKEIFKFLESIEDKVSRGLALYGLAESKRVEELIKDFSPEKLGEHLNISHLAEVNYYFDAKHQAHEISEEDKLNYLFDNKTPLEKHSGYYHASTKENDTLQYFTKNHEGVYGSSITGAGFGGNNVAVVCSPKAEALKQYLISKYYKSSNPDEDYSLLHISKSNNGVSLI